MLKILIADDEMIERRYLTAVFRKYPQLFTVVGEARNGREVIRQATLLRPDVIIMDINMPFSDGLTCAGEIKQMYPETIILLNTAYAEFEFARRAVEYQLDAYLLKPAAEELILRTIEECLRKKRAAIDSRPGYMEVRGRDSDPMLSPIDLVADYIDANTHRPLPLQELARIAHFSPSYLSRLFRERKGITISAYITQKRMDHAKYLLGHTTLDIQTVAAHCGFQTISHFNRVFKQNTGQSPMEFRRQFINLEDENAGF